MRTERVPQKPRKRSPESPSGLLDFERKYWSSGCVRIAGVDEAGRGPLAGPVVAAAVIIAREFAESELQRALNGVNDSKTLDCVRREHFCELLFHSECVQIGIGQVDSVDIDRINILNATHLAMIRAVTDLPSLPDLALIDGRPIKGLPCVFDAIVAGDSRSLSVAAASIVAKVVRDDHMRDLDRIYPAYGFAAHKGYGTNQHIQALFEFGPCAEHRRSFRPVREVLEIRRRTGEGNAELGTRNSE